MDSIFHVQYQGSQTPALRMLLSCRTSQIREIGSGKLRVLRRSDFMCESGCMAFRYTESFKTSLGSCLGSCYLALLLVPGPVTGSPAASVLPPWALCGHFSMSLSFLFPHLCAKEKHSTHSFIPQIVGVLPSYPAFRPLPPTFPSFVRRQKELAESGSMMLSCFYKGSVSHSNFCKICLLGNPHNIKSSS